MNLLRQIDLNTLVTLVGCGFACLIMAGVLGTILHFVGAGLSIISSILHIFFSLINGGPVVWCGCLLALMACGACSLVTLALLAALPNCGTSHALNICRLFGY